MPYNSIMPAIEFDPHELAAQHFANQVMRLSSDNDPFTVLSVAALSEAAQAARFLSQEDSIIVDPDLARTYATTLFERISEGDVVPVTIMGPNPEEIQELVMQIESLRGTMQPPDTEPVVWATTQIPANTREYVESVVFQFALNHIDDELLIDTHTIPDTIFIAYADYPFPRP